MTTIQELRAKVKQKREARRLAKGRRYGSRHSSAEECKPSAAEYRGGKDATELPMDSAKSAGEDTPKRKRRKSGRGPAGGDSSAARDEQAASPAKSKSAEIDDLFAGKTKRKSKEEPQTEEKAPPRAKRSKSAAGGAPAPGAVRYTEDGLRIYTYDDIRADQPVGLDGPCPFDCGCCF